MIEMSEKELDDLRLDAALHALAGVVATFGYDIEVRKEVIAFKAILIGEEFVRKWVKRQEEKEQYRASLRQLI